MEKYIDLLKHASAEIKCLQRENELMRAKLSVFDNVMQLLNAHTNYNSIGAKEDLAWIIDKELMVNEVKTTAQGSTVNF